MLDELGVSGFWSRKELGESPGSDTCKLCDLWYEMLLSFHVFLHDMDDGDSVHLMDHVCKIP